METYTELAIELVERCQLTDCGSLEPEQAAQTMKEIIIGTLKAHKNLDDAVWDAPQMMLDIKKSTITVEWDMDRKCWLLSVIWRSENISRHRYTYNPAFDFADFWNEIEQFLKE